MRLRKIHPVALLAATLVFGAVPAAHANLLVNGSFETGNFTGWTLGGNTSFTGVNFGPGFAQDGNYYAYIGPVGSDGSLSQTFADNAGTTYTFTGWMQSSGGSPSDFGIYLNGTQETYLNPVPYQGWTEYTFQFTGTGSDTLLFINRNDPGSQYLDNLSVSSAPGPVPGAGVAGLTALMLVGLYARTRRA